MRCLFLCDPFTLRNLESLPEGIKATDDADKDLSLYEQVIRWGAVRPKSAVSIGSSRASRQTADLQATEPVLRLNGLVNVSPVPRITRSKNIERHRIYLFEQHTFGHDIFSGGRWRPYEGTPRSRELLSDIARRAVHCLHLEAGVVDLWVTRAKWSVVRVASGVPLPPRLARALSDAITKWWRSTRGPRTAISLGADPEFVMYDRRTGRMIRASRFFRKEGEIGCDSVLGQPEVSIGELRPEAGRAPEIIVSRLREAIMRAKRQVGPQIGFRAGSTPFRNTPIGGHIHFRGIPFTSEILRALDTYLAIPVFLIEVPESARHRRRRYGYLGDARRKAHGGFEYRTLPSWLVSPEVASAVLCLAVVIIFEAHRLRRRPFSDVGLQSAFYKGEKAPFYKLFPALWDEIRSTYSYAAFADELSLFPQWINKRHVWPERSDIWHAWSDGTAQPAGAPRSLSMPHTSADRLLPPGLATPEPEQPHSLVSLRSALTLFGSASDER